MAKNWRDIASLLRPSALARLCQEVCALLMRHILVDNGPLDLVAANTVESGVGGLPADQPVGM